MLLVAVRRCACADMEPWYENWRRGDLSFIPAEGYGAGTYLSASFLIILPGDCRSQW